MKKQKVNINEFGKIMQDMYHLAYSSENGTWFLKKESFDDGTYTFEDYLELKENIDYLKEIGIKDIDLIIESISPKETDDTVAIFYGSFVDLFQETEFELATRLTMFMKNYDSHEFQNIKEMSENDAIVDIRQNLSKPKYIKEVINYLENIYLKDLDDEQIIERSTLLDELSQIKDKENIHNHAYEYDDYEIEM